MGFAGFGPEAFAWFAGLEADNSKAWFQAHRDTYDNGVRGPLNELLEELAGDAPVHVSRPNRDLRFSKDKTPYKPRTGIGRDAALDHLRDTWTACAPLLAWLDEHVGASEEPAPSRP